MADYNPPKVKKRVIDAAKEQGKAIVAYAFNFDHTPGDGIGFVGGNNLLDKQSAHDALDFITARIGQRRTEVEEMLVTVWIASGGVPPVKGFNVIHAKVQELLKLQPYKKG